MNEIVIDNVADDDWMKSLPGYAAETTLHDVVRKRLRRRRSVSSKPPTKESVKKAFSTTGILQNKPVVVLKETEDEGRNVIGEIMEAVPSQREVVMQNPPNIVIKPNIIIRMPRQKPPVVNITIPEQKPPVVNVSVPQQKPPVVNVSAPDVNLPELKPEIKIIMPEQPPPHVTVELPSSNARVMRDVNGRIVGIVREKGE